MPLPADVVENDRPDVRIWIVLLEAQRHRAHAPGRGRRVQDEDDRGLQHLGEVRGRTFFAPAVVAVVQAHHTLDDRDPGALGGAGEQLRHSIRKHPGVEVARPAVQQYGMVHRIEEVGPGLERLRIEASFLQREQDADSDGRLAHPAPFSGDDHSGAARFTASMH